MRLGNTIQYNIHLESSTCSATFCTHRHKIYFCWFSCPIQGAVTAEVAPQLGNRSSSLSPSLGIHRGWNGSVLLISTRFRSVVFFVAKNPFQFDMFVVDLIIAGCDLAICSLRSLLSCLVQAGYGLDVAEGYRFFPESHGMSW